MISYDLLSSFLYIFLKAIYAYEKEFEKPGNRQQATGNRQRLSAPPTDHGHTTQAAICSLANGS